MASNRRQNGDSSEGGLLDATNLRLLAELQADARLSLAELGRRVGLSSPAVGERLARLERDGVIRGYHADIDPEALGRGLEITVLVELTVKDRETVEGFERRVAAMDPVIECRRMFGVPDYVIRVAVADIAAYEAFYMSELAGLPGLGRVSSQFTMKVVKS